MTLSKFARECIFRYVESAPEVKEILDDDEISHIRDRNQSGIFKNRFFEPKHSRPRRTYRVQILIDENFDLKTFIDEITEHITCLLYTSPSPRDGLLSRMPSSA